MSDFLWMGGYAVYVWASFAFAVAMLGGLLALSMLSARKRERELNHLRGQSASQGQQAATQRPARPIVARRETETG